MPASLTVADVIDKNKIASANAWIILFKIEIQDATGAPVETLYFAKNNEQITWRGNVYLPTDFDIDFTKDTNQEPSMKVTVFDPTNAVRGALEDYGGGVGFPVTMSVVNSGNLSANPELDEEFEVLSTSAPAGTFQIEFTLGAENPLKAEFPYRRQYRDRCPFPYKGKRCGYTGNIAGCDYTLNGANGCRVHENIARFGAFPGLQSSNQ